MYNQKKTWEEIGNRRGTISHLKYMQAAFKSVHRNNMHRSGKNSVTKHLNTDIWIQMGKIWDQNSDKTERQLKPLHI